MATSHLLRLRSVRNPRELAAAQVRACLIEARDAAGVSPCAAAHHAERHSATCPSPQQPIIRRIHTADVLPGHAIVLSTSSVWMRRQIEAWSAAGGENAPPSARPHNNQPTGGGGAGGGAQHAQHPNITLHVRPGQEEAARRLVRFIYEGPASMPSAASAAAAGAGGQACQALLVDMLALSYTYRVPTCVCAARWRWD